MASGKTWTNICPECGKHVEILNGDFEFSMDLHNQSHKPLDYVNTVDNQNLNQPTVKMDSNTKLKLNYCQVCNESFQIINNDLGLSFQLHAQRHKNDNLDALSDHSSNSSSKSRGSRKNEKEQAQAAVTSILDALFQTMPVGLQAHRNFISEKSCSKAICNLCETTIEPIFKVSEHLKTKLHEDNTITAIKAMLSSELNDQMEFVSFYGSNLCCNLCRCKIDLNSDNLHKTIVNIITHNAGKGHLSKRSLTMDSNHTDKSMVILKNVTLLSSLISENQHFIEHKMYPHFICKPCDKQIAFSENQNEMIKNFTDHFNSQDHVKYLNAVSLLTRWSTLNITGKENHDFCVNKQKIYCLSCNIDIETNLDQLLAHVRRTSSLYGVQKSDLMAGVQTINSPSASSSVTCKEPNIINSGDEGVKVNNSCQQFQTQERSAKLRRLVQSLPAQFRKIISEDEKGQAVCLICKCTIPVSTYNITTHLNGSSHKKKQNEVQAPNTPHPQPSEVINSAPSFTQPQKPFNPRAAETQSSLEVELDILASKNHLFQANREYIVKGSGDNRYICILCGTFIQSDVSSFQGTIISHIKGQDHINKIKLKEEMSLLLPRHNDFLVRELFNSIPMSFQSHVKYIKAPEGYNFVFCEICCVKIPRHSTCLLEHLEGGYHETSVERLSGIQSKQNILPKPASSQPLNNPNNVLYLELVKRNREIKFNSQFLTKDKEDYFCKLCKAVIKNSYDINLLEVNILSHVSGKKHRKNVENNFNDMLDKIQTSSTIVKNNRKFLKKENENVLCILCPCQMSYSDSVDTLKYNLEVHFLGSAHKSKCESLNNSGFVAPSPAPPPESYAPRLNSQQSVNQTLENMFHGCLDTFDALGFGSSIKPRS